MIRKLKQLYQWLLRIFYRATYLQHNIRGMNYRVTVMEAQMDFLLRNANRTLRRKWAAHLQKMFESPPAHVGSHQRPTHKSLLTPQTASDILTVKMGGLEKATEQAYEPET